MGQTKGSIDLLNLGLDLVMDSLDVFRHLVRVENHTLYILQM